MVRKKIDESRFLGRFREKLGIKTAYEMYEKYLKNKIASSTYYRLENKNELPPSWVLAILVESVPGASWELIGKVANE